MTHHKLKILVCGVLPPPNFGHSMMYKMLMSSSFVKEYDIVFFEMKFWSYAKHKKVTFDKLFKMIVYWFSFIGLIIRHRPKCILFNMSFDKMPLLKDYLFCLTGRILGCRIILHDMGQYLPELRQLTSGILRGVLNHLLKITYAIIVMGEKVKQEYQQFFPYQRMVVVPGSVEDSAQLTIAVDNKKDARKTVLYFSYLSVSKGVWTALKAVKHVAQQRKDIRFIFAGPVESPALLQEINAYIKDNHLNDCFQYMGYIEDTVQRTAYYRSADVFIFPTLRDVFGLVLLHALAERVPVIASREGAIPEIIQDGINGLLFDKGDDKQLAIKIMQLMDDQQLRQLMAVENRKRYEEYYSPAKYGVHMIKALEVIDHMENKLNTRVGT